MSYVRILGSVTLLLSVLAASATPGRAVEIKPADQAFQFHAQLLEEEGIELVWSVAPGYYLYRDRIAVTINGKTIQADTEKGELKHDPTFGLTEIYHSSAVATVAAGLLPEKGKLIVTYQGCGENTICYPPISKAIDLATLQVEDAPEGGSSKAISSRKSASESYNATLSVGTPVSAGAPVSATTGGIETESAMLSGSLSSTLLAFLGFGLLLSFTPCVFPMIPILSGMLAKSGGNLSLGRSLALSATYVLAMALAYSMLGVFAAWSGENLQAALQTPTAIIAMSAVFLILALSMFGLFELQLPQSWTSRLISSANNKGSIGGSAVLGFGSALIVGPCVTPPLAAALIFVAQTGDVLRGSLALFALGLGMGLPLIAFGVLGSKVLPRSGAWLARVKHLFGFIFVALAIWMVSRVLPLAFTAVAIGALFIAIGLYFDVTSFFKVQQWRPLRLAAASAGVLALAYGSILVVGAAFSYYEPLRPLASIGFVAPVANASSFTDQFQVVSNEAELDEALASARKQGRTAMVDFSADWCTECRLMERNVFAKEIVQQQLRQILLIRADLTHFGQPSKRLMQRFGVVGPPTVVFLNPDGSEIADARVVGDIGVNGFLSKIAKALRA